MSHSDRIHPSPNISCNLPLPLNVSRDRPAREELGGADGADTEGSRGGAGRVTEGYAARTHRRMLDATFGALVVFGILTPPSIRFTPPPLLLFLPPLSTTFSIGILRDRNLWSAFDHHRILSLWQGWVRGTVMSSLRADELRTFILDLQYFVVDHRHVTVTTPETEARMAEYERRLRLMVERNGITAGSALKVEDSWRRWRAIKYGAERGKMEKSTV